jgi:hypothetical protein
VREKLKQALRLVREQLGVREAFFFSGLGSLAYGVAQLSSPAAWCIVGLFLMAAARRGRAE